MTVIADALDDMRFWAKVDKTGDCWLWTAGCIRNGYGSFWNRHTKQMMQAHRWAWERTVGPIPEGLTLDHVSERCSSKKCVRPDHLEPVTALVNTERWAEQFLTREVCSKGHRLDAANTYITTAGKIRCRTCRRKNREDYLVRQAGV